VIKRKTKPSKATLLITHEDAININLGMPLAYHLPFSCLQAYYDGGIHRPLAVVGSVAARSRVGHEFYPNVGMFLPPGEGSPGEPFSPDSWLAEGVCIDQNKYDVRDVIGAHIKTVEGQEMVFTAVESVNGQRPFATSIRNFTQTTDFLPKVTLEQTTARVHSWRDKIEANLPHMKLSWGEPEVSKTVFYVGSGPSLRRNYAELKRLDRSKASVWATNQAFEYLAKNGVPVDYFFCMDATAFAEWWEGIDCSETCLVASPFVNPEILKANWKAVYWYNIKADSFYYNQVRRQRPHLLQIDGHRGVGSALIESVWPKGVQRVVLVGCDFCYEPEGNTMWRSAGWHLDHDAWRKLANSHAHYIVYNAQGQQVPTYLGLAFEAAAVFGAIQCLWEKDITVVNSTEGGILRLNPTCRYLVNAVQKRGVPLLPELPLSEAVETVNRNLT